MTPHLLVNASSYPVTPGAATVNLNAIALDGADLYYVLEDLGPAEGGPSDGMPLEAGAVLRVPATGGQPTQVAAGYVFQAPVFTPSSVILGELNAYPNNDPAAIVSAPKDGSAATTLVTVVNGSLDLFPNPATEGTSVYYLDQNGIEAIPLDPAAATAGPTRVAQEDPLGIGVFGQYLLLFTEGGVDSVSLAPGDSGKQSVLATGLPDGGVDLVPCGTNACWLATAFGVLEEIDPAGAGPAVTIADLSDRFSHTLAVAFDGTWFFVTGSFWPAATPGTVTTSSGAIVKIPRHGGSPIDLVTMPDSDVGPIAVDDECVYFSTPAGIFSLAKTAEDAVIQ